MEKREKRTSSKKMRKASFNKIELAVYNFNCEPLHDHGGNYAENFNIRNIACKHGRVAKHDVTKV